MFCLVGEMARAAQRAARHSCTTRCQRVAEAVFALDFAFAFVRVEHVERVVVRGLLDDEHETNRIDDITAAGDLLHLVAVCTQGEHRLSRHRSLRRNHDFT